MLNIASKTIGYDIVATDGELGTVSDFLFDDASWKVRWLVVDTGNWLPGRKVLLPPMVLGHPNPDEKQFPVRMTKQQVKDSPDIDTERPVSRQMEADVYEYYGWSPYWGTGFYMGGYMPGYGFIEGARMQPAASEAPGRAQQITAARQEDGDPHLRSIKAVMGHHINATDGEIGHVEDFLMNDTDWNIHYLVVDTKNWWPGKKVLISPRSAQEIDWNEKLVHLDVTRHQVKESTPYDASKPLGRTYERRHAAE
mgnify:CR=1 FL=1